MRRWNATNKTAVNEKRRAKYAADQQVRAGIRASQKKYASENPDVQKQNSRRHYEGQREAYIARSRRQQLKTRFGITEADYERMLQEQQGVCAICNRTCATGKRLAVDHCHDAGRIRGLLCKNCNTAIGLLSDEPARLEKAIAYLKK
jgi:hypothetical protein